MRDKKVLVVVKGLVCNKDKVLLVKRSNNESIGGGLWELPGGKVDFGEEIEVALERELSEEIGIEVKIDSFLYTSTFVLNGSVHIVTLTYLCFTKKYDVKLSSEHSAYLWIIKKDILKYITDKKLDEYLNLK